MNVKNAIRLGLLCYVLLIPSNILSEPLNNSDSFFFRNETLKTVLNIFSNKVSLASIKISPDITDQTLSSQISGIFKNSDKYDLLNQLAQIYGFNWFVFSDDLYITSNRTVSRSVVIDPSNMPSVKESLLSNGLLNKKFGYAEFPSDSRVIVSGPSEYVALVIANIKQLQVAPSQQEYGVYHLRYANATDVSLSYNNTSTGSAVSVGNAPTALVIPGIATILQNLAQGNSSRASPGAISELYKNSATSFGESSNSAGKDNFIARSSANIQADWRLNTIIIRDTPANLDVYKQLINALDIPAPLISVEVLVVDVHQDDMDQKGISWWSGAGGSGGIGFDTAGLTSLNKTAGLAAAYGQVSSGQLVISNSAAFLASIHFLEQNNIAKSTSKPTLTTVDNIPAVASIAKSSYGQGGGGAPSVLQSTTALSITPHVIFQKGFNDIKLSISLLDGELPADGSGFGTSPLMYQSSLNSQAVLKEGQSLLLASYNKVKEGTVVSQVPYLGSIPLIGWFFKSQKIVKYTTTTLYLVTPKIVWLSNPDEFRLKDFVVVDGQKFSVHTQQSLYESTSNAVQPQSR